jgi:hypothetical protein
MKDPINENGVSSPTINPKRKGKAPQQNSPNDKKQCKYKDKYWIRSKRTEHEAMVFINNSKRTKGKPGLFQGRTRRCKLQKNSVKNPMRVKQLSRKNDSRRAGTTKNQMEAKSHKTISTSKSNQVMAGR